MTQDQAKVYPAALGRGEVEVRVSRGDGGEVHIERWEKLPSGNRGAQRVTLTVNEARFVLRALADEL